MFNKKNARILKLHLKGLSIEQIMKKCGNISKERVLEALKIKENKS